MEYALVNYILGDGPDAPQVLKSSAAGAAKTSNSKIKMARSVSPHLSPVELILK